MSDVGNVEKQHDIAADTVQQLKLQLKASERQITRLVELLERQQSQLASQEASIARLDRILMEILTGRTWRALRAAGDLIKKVVPLRSKTGEVSVSRKHRSILKCDEPRVGDTRPRSGKITVRGWCLAEGGVDSVEVEVPGIPILQTEPNMPRPDVKKELPEWDRTGRSGFAVEFDSLALANGQYPIKIRVVQGREIIHETSTSVWIDHEKGFSSDYDRWIYEFEQPADELIQIKIGSLESSPLISIVMPVYNTDETELTAAIQSVLAQSYRNWELCIADDRSDKEAVSRILRHFADQDSRIKLRFQTERGGISRTANAAARMAVGDYVCFLDHDDTLAPHALAYVCEALDRNPDADLLYSDEDKIDARGKRYDPFLKPDWSPDLLHSENYICHLLVFRRDLLEKIGDFNPDCDGSQDYDLILRAMEAAGRIVHIPRVLYHWRAGVASTASTADNKQYALDAAHRALQNHCDRLGRGMWVEPGKILGRWRVRYPIAEGSRVSIIIPSGGKVDVLRTNLESLLSKTTYKNYEVVIADNSKQYAIEKLVAELQTASHTLRYFNWRNKPFNYSAINNAAAATCDSPVLLFLNDDTSVIAPEWLEAMVELAVRPDVGAVGAKLLYPDDRIQHAGVIMGLYDNCGHAFKGLDGRQQHYFDFPDVIRNVSAVTGACLMTRAKLFHEVGGFDETDFAVAFNDIDFCLKIGTMGHRVLYTAHALLYHHEAYSKTSKDLIPHPAEVEKMREKWREIIEADPYYNPNLTKNDEDYGLRKKI